MMERKEIESRLLPLVREAFKDDALELSDGLNASSVEGWTSLSFMQLLERIEAEFGFRFKVFELLGINNMGGLIDAIGRHC